MNKKNIDDIRLEHILDIQHIREMNDAFAFAMDLASTVVDLRGNPIAGPSNHSKVCRLIRSSPEGLTRCMRSAMVLGKKAHDRKRPYASACHSVGFVDGAAPIIVQGRHIATWLVGQADLGKVNEERIIHYAREIGVDENEMQNAFQQMTGISSEQFVKKLGLIWRLAQNVSALGFKNYQYAKAMERLNDYKTDLENYKNDLEIMVDTRTRELRDALDRLEQLSNTDHLTACFNRMYLQQQLENELKKAKRYNRPLSIIMFDIDHFKHVNDRFGHQCGDHVLIEIAKTIQSCIRHPIDWLVRFGGEEFLLVLPETTNSNAGRVAERLRKTIESLVIYCEKSRIAITASFGIATSDCRQAETSGSGNDLILTADNNLYRAKADGRNTVFGFVPEEKNPDLLRKEQKESAEAGAGKKPCKK